MTFKLANRIKETSDTTGTGDINLTGNLDSFETFSSILNDGDTTFYVVEDVNNWEVGIGTFASNRIVRTTILSSSNNGNPINLVGSSHVSLTYPSERSVYLNDALNTVAGSGIVFTNDTPILDADNGSLYWDNNKIGYESDDIYISGVAAYASGIAVYASGQVAPNQQDAFRYISTESIQFDTESDPTLSQGEIGWNSTFGTLDIGYTDTYIMHIGEETHFRVRNVNDDPLYKGQAVYAAGIHNDNTRLLINKFTADGSIPEIRFIGLVTETLNKNQSGFTTNFGYIKGVDSRGNVENPIAVGDETWQVGDILYVHPTVAGKLTKVKPKHAIIVAIIMYVHQNQGLLLVRPKDYGHIEDTHNVNVDGLSDNNFLVYNSGTDNWEPSSGLYYSGGSVVVDDSISATSGTFTTIKSPQNTDLFLAPSGEAAIVCDKSITVPYNVESDASTITFNMHNSNIHTVTLGGNRTLAVSNVDVGQTFIIRLTQDNVGSRTVNWFAGISWPSNMVPILTLAPNKTDVFGFMCTGSNQYDGFIMAFNI